MADNNEDAANRQKERKFAKHFDILINGRRVKILNFQIKEYKDLTESGRIIELISGQKFDKADQSEALIKIDTGNQIMEISGKWKFSRNGPGNYTISYWINELKELTL